MARYFNNKEIELLAPAGNFEILKEIITSGCDAVYFGGKNFNMRLHRKDYNLSNEELYEAVALAHKHGKKAYITVNNMYNNEEVEQLKDFLHLLTDIKPDALIVQDFAVIQLIKEMGLPLSIHSSVMMNTHNLPMIHQLKELGVSRVVISREASLEYCRYIKANSDMELEYFIHGDMCVTHGSQCIYSGILFGQSSNRGRCLKPCRWGYQVQQEDYLSHHHYPLAVKDMFMYEHLPELIHAGVNSFKIEGRMRNIDYLKMIVDAYADSLDRYIDDPLAYDRKKDSKLLYDNRKRDTSTAYALGKPGLSNINERYEGTGALYSSGKVFSIATKEREITSDKLDQVKATLHENSIADPHTPTLSVKVNSMEQARFCLSQNVDEIYLSGDVFIKDKPFSRKDMEELWVEKGNSKIYLCFPHMTFDSQYEEYQHLLSKGLPVDGFVATNLGNLWALKGQEFHGDYPLNILNQKAFQLYQELGLKRFTISPEGSLSEVISLIQSVTDKAELIVHGSPTVMYMEHDLYENVNGNTDSLLSLVDEAGYNHPIYKDQYGRNHMLLYKNLCYLPILKELHEVGLSHFRLEIPHLEKKDFEEIVTLYKKALSDLTLCQQLFEQSIDKTLYTLGTFSL